MISMLNKSRRFISCLVAVAFLACSSAYASQYSKELAIAEEQIASWLEKVNSQIINQAHYRTLAKLLSKRLRTDENVTCIMCVTRDGQIENSRIMIPSQHPQVDKAVLNLVSCAAPLQIPPNKLACLRAVVIKFQKEGRKIRCTCETGRLINARIGESKLDW